MKVKKRKIEEVDGSTFCTYSVIENKLATLSKNQKVIFEELQDIKNLIVNKKVKK